MEKIIITPEMLREANDTIPLMERQELLENIAADCISRVRMTFIPTGETEEQPMPERYQEYRVNTALYLMGVLAVKYLKQSFGGEGESLKMPLNQYDNWNASHVLSQIENFKADKDLRDKAFNLLTDYREFRNALYREIETVLGHHNDVVWRLVDAVNLMTKQAVNTALETQTEQTGKAEETSEEHEQKRQQAVAALTAALNQLSDTKERLQVLKGKVDSVE